MRAWSSRSADARVRYQRNPGRLGAMRNMFQSITAGRGKYTLAFHEDDLARRSLPRRLRSRILESDPACGFVGGELREFDSAAAGRRARRCGLAVPQSSGSRRRPTSCG